MKREEPKVKLLSLIVALVFVLIPTLPVHAQNVNRENVPLTPEEISDDYSGEVVQPEHPYCSGDEKLPIPSMSINEMLKVQAQYGGKLLYDSTGKISGLDIDGIIFTESSLTKDGCNHPYGTVTLNYDSNGNPIYSSVHPHHAYATCGTCGETVLHPSTMPTTQNYSGCTYTAGRYKQYFRHNDESLSVVEGATEQYGEDGYPLGAWTDVSFCNYTMQAFTAPTFSGHVYTHSLVTDVNGSGVSSPSATRFVYLDSSNTTGHVRFQYDNHTHTWGATTYSSAHPHPGTHTCTVCGATETVSASSYSSTCSTCNSYAINLYDSNFSVNVGSTYSISYSVTPSGTSITWISSNTAVATVSNGVVTGVSAGTVTITAKVYNPYSQQFVIATCTGEVTNPSPSTYNISSGFYRIKNKYNNYYLSGSGEGSVLGTVSKTSAASQVWYINTKGNGTHCLINGEYNAEKTTGQQLNYVALSSYEYEWYFVTSPNGYCYISSNSSGTDVMIADGSVYVGGVLSNSLKDEWVFEPVGFVFDSVYDSSISSSYVSNAVDYAVSVFSDFDIIISAGTTTANNNIIGGCNYPNAPCNNNCSSNCSNHHKNINRIAGVIYNNPQENHIYSFWADKPNGVFCQKINGSCSPINASGIAHPSNPVIEILNVSHESNKTFNSSQINGISKMVFVHEIAHIFGLPEQTGTTGRHSDGEIDCAMRYSYLENLSVYYNYCNGDPFCIECWTDIYYNVIKTFFPG